jgi:hypothetical protein
MAPKPEPIFIANLPMAASRVCESIMHDRFQDARRITDVVLGGWLITLALMRESKIWAATKEMPRGQPKSAVCRAYERLRSGATEQTDRGERMKKNNVNGDGA